MKVKLLHTEGNGKFEEIDWDKPEPTENEIEVKAVMTGVCRSDIDMMEGNFGPLPLSMQGHEGLGVVTKVGSNITDVNIGDYVATRGEPAYADYYNTREDEFVVVPALDPKFIIEPVACGVNIVMQPYDEIKKRSGNGKRCLILGSGFLAWITYNTLSLTNLSFDEIVVVGNHNKDLWGDKLSQTHEGTFDVVIDLSSNTDVLDRDFVNNEALVVFGVQKKITSDFGNLLWKACSIVFPSPRTERFIEAMRYSATWVNSGALSIDNFWTKSYNRSTEWEKAFEDGINRPQGYSRGYIKWD
jgi:D-arabinose 1-dehydrogenase-like Zn-dependent alcohol dehydrogenase